MGVGHHFDRSKQLANQVSKKIKGLVVNEPEGSAKTELNFKSLKIIALFALFIFLIVVFLLPNDPLVEFSQKTDSLRTDSNASAEMAAAAGGASEQSAASAIWGSPKMGLPSSQGGGGQINHNTSMVLGSKNGNAKTQLRAGQRLSLRVLDKVIVSQESVPILAELMFDSATDSGLKLPAGTRFYGEASYQKGSSRAQIRFKQISLPSGQIRPISGLALGKDSQPGIPGRVFSDGMKNTAGQVITAFVAGLAAGSVETDFLGHSKGGIQNGLLTAVSATAKDRAQAYGEKLKTEREWIEIANGAECDAVLSDSLNLQEGGDQYDP